MSEYANPTVESEGIPQEPPRAVEAPAPEPGSPQAALAPYTTEQLVATYVARRDLVKEIKKKHSEELARPTAAMDMLEAELLRRLYERQELSVRTEAGTAYRSTTTSVTAQDWQAALAFIVKHEAWEFLEQRVSKAAVEAYIEDHGVAPPGVKVTQATSLNVRRG